MLKYIILTLIFAFVLGVLIYVGGALLQTINFARIPQPGSSLAGALTGVVLGAIFALLGRRQRRAS